MRAPRFVSIFSGCGGFDLGFVQAGFDPVHAFDHWPAATSNFERNIGGKCSVADLRSGSLSLDEDCDVLLSGAPCQGFSTAGKRDVLDPRNQLLGAGVSIALQIKPKVVVLENVPGVTFGDHHHYWKQAKQRLSSAGYEVEELCMNASSFGVAQARKRIILVAIRGRFKKLTLPKPSPILNLANALAGVDRSENHNPRFLEKNSRDGMIAAHIRPGQKLCDVRSGPTAVHSWNVPEVFGATTINERDFLQALSVLRRRSRVRSFGDADPVSLETLHAELGRGVERIARSLEKKEYIRRSGDMVDLKRTFNGKYRRLVLEELSPTVHTKFGDANYFLHPVEHRGLTVREAARIQGFPDTYKFEGALRDQFKMIGNAVPPPLGRGIGQAIMNAAFKGRA
ncbi:DNA cytosine methyltransferase [Stenotrophomonas rhizophila]|uniref:DNA cytosine methyltransferase n=1 Tax=Stenotrophomonas rhizophila TaxID=216778 RepID=UPI0035143CF9